MTTKRLEDRLIVFDSLAGVTGSNDNNVSTTGEKSHDELNSNQALTDTGAQSVLSFKNVKVDRLLRGSDLTLEVEERNLPDRQKWYEHSGDKGIEKSGGCEVDHEHEDQDPYGETSSYKALIQFFWSWPISGRNLTTVQNLRTSSCTF